MRDPINLNSTDNLGVPASARASTTTQAGSTGACRMCR